MEYRMILSAGLTTLEKKVSHEKNILIKHQLKKELNNKK